MEKPIRILHMIGSLNIGGSQTMIVNLYKAIDRTKIQFDFIIDKPGELFYANEIKALGAKIYEFPTFNGKNIVQIKKTWKVFFDFHPEYKVLHSHIRSYASLYLPIARSYGVKTIIHSHSTSNGSGITSLAKQILQYPLRYQADYFFACSELAGRWLFGDNVLNKGNFYVVRNAIDSQRFRFNSETRYLYREKLSLTNEKVYLHVGRFNEAKNHSFLLKMFSEMVNKSNNIRLVLVGDGIQRDVITNLIKELNLNKYVLLLGNRSDIPEIMCAADCFLFPSLWEGLGIAAIEAQAAGLKCICSENVPDEVKILPTCKFLNLHDMDMWVREALSSDCSRYDVKDEILDAGYDIKNTAIWIEHFYEKISI